MQSQHEILMQDPEFCKEFAIEKFIGECTEVVSRIMHEKQVSKADLARRLGKSRAWVTQLLSGRRNVTARTLAEVAYELGAELRVESSLHSANLDRSEWREMGSLTIDRKHREVKAKVIQFRLTAKGGTPISLAAEDDGLEEENESEFTRAIA